MARARARTEPRGEACLVQEVVYGTLLLRDTSVRDVVVGAPRGQGVDGELPSTSDVVGADRGS